MSFLVLQHHCDVQILLKIAWLFELAGGAIADNEDTCLPKAQREASFTVAALHQWDIDIHDERCVKSAEEWISDTLLPVTSGGPFPSVSTICCVSSHGVIDVNSAAVPWTSRTSRSHHSVFRKELATSCKLEEKV